MSVKIHSWPAFAFFIICASVVLGVLFGPIVYNRTWGSIGIVHLYVVLSLSVAIGAGMFYGDEDNTIFMRIGWGALFIIGTLLCVGLSGGRGKALLESNVDQAKQSIERHNEQAKRVSDARSMIDAASKALAVAQANYDRQISAAKRECDNGAGPACRGANLSTERMMKERDDAKQDVREATKRHEEAESKLTAIPTTSTPNPELEQFARLYSFIRNSSQDDARSAINLLLPYFLAAVAELGTILFAQRAFHSPPAVAVSPAPSASHQPGGDHRSIGDIARALRIEPKVARKAARSLGVQKSAAGQWSWPKPEADSIEQRIALSRSAGQGHA